MAVSQRQGTDRHDAGGGCGARRASCSSPDSGTPSRPTPSGLARRVRRGLLAYPGRPLAPGPFDAALAGPCSGPFDAFRRLIRAGRRPWASGAPAERVEWLPRLAPCTPPLLKLRRGQAQRVAKNS
jgi:hypothetical protein